MQARATQHREASRLEVSMAATYAALVRKEPDSSFGVELPDFPGCISAGDTAAEALQHAQEALSLHVRGMVDDGESIPEPRSLDAIMNDPELREDIREHRVTYGLVPLTDLRGRALRIQ